MLISQLVKKLNELKEQHGDIPVCHWDDWDFFEVSNAELYEDEMIALGGSPVDLHASSPRWSKET